MHRHAFKMFLHPGQAEEYERRHDEIWPEVSALLSDAGVRNYSILLDLETNVLFAYRAARHRTAAPGPIGSRKCSTSDDGLQGSLWPQRGCKPKGRSVRRIDRRCREEPRSGDPAGRQAP